MSGALKVVAASLFKIANDIRFLGSDRAADSEIGLARKRTRQFDHAGEGEPDSG